MAGWYGGHAEREKRMIPGEVVALMSRRRLVVEIRTDTAVQAVGAIEALVLGGVSVMEVSLATPGAQEILSHFAARPDVLVGAGSVLEASQAAVAISFGARFISSPILAVDIVPVCREKNVTCILGALTPSEIITAQRAGAEMVKLFPVEHLGGPSYVRALFRQLTHLSLQISGGFTFQSLREYALMHSQVRSLAIGESLVSKALVQQQSWQALTNRARVFAQFFANPQAGEAQLAAMLGFVPQRPVPAPMPAAMMPGPNAASNGYRPENIPTQSIPPGSVPVEPAATGGFRPWDSRPVKEDGEEDWLR